ncbi:hypothetical protein DH2020_029314 [Rehmannia glutinosa]|uniref:Uncharacterized protein n=1 Tax=Rehmannia glutinosa TaxID=99300 RepID=A0ABR0VQQ1_REHGL
MAAHSNRSPSPLSSRPTNPNPRNSENHSATRRSFSGNNPFAKPSALTNPRRFDPITPANSPADFARRRSVGKEGNPKDCEEKENDEKDNILKTCKLQSPAKGSKNFMSPTISAASKFTPSPRKKVLVERNEPVRTSISLSDGKAMFFSNTPSNVSVEPKSEMGYNQNQKNESSLDLNAANSEKNEAVQEDHPISKPSKKVTFLEVPKESELVTESQSESVITDSDDSLKMEPSSKNKDSISPSIAPLDADPSLPPYDPKTNYLSPRPQFLHYKPNPRIEILLNKEKELDPDEFECLEDRFIAEIMSENLSDSEGTEESQTDDSQKEEMEMEVSASADMVIGFEETEDDLHVSEQNAIFEENFVQKNEKKTWAFSKLKCFSVVIMVLIACVSISVTRSPSLEEFAFNDLSLSDLSNFYHHQSRVVTASARENFDRLTRRLNQLSVNSISFISKLANELGKGDATLGPLKYMNLSDLQKESSWNGEIFLNNKLKEELVENFEEYELEEDLDTEMDKFEEDEEFDYDESFDTKEEDVVLESEEEMSTDSVKSSELESEYSEDIQNQTEVVSSSTNTVLLDAISQDHQESEIEAAVEVVSSDDRLKTEKSHVDDINLDSSALLDQESPSNVNSLSEECVQISEDKFLAHYYYAMGVSSFFAALLAVAAAFIYRYKRNPGSANVVEPNPLLSKQTMYQEKKAFSQNWQTEVDESSCPSEMSSFQKSASYSKKEMRDASEIQSIERKTRKYNSKRESLASSSSEFTGSPSYGSFTTFERIPIKHANGEEEIITPVRRSSRIRSHQVISP